MTTSATEAFSRMVVGLLGPVTVWCAGETAPVPGRLDRLLLAHLTLAEGRSLSVDALIDALWGDDAPAQARNAVQVKISRLRRHLGPHGDLLQHTQGSYRLLLQHDQTDVGAFTQLVQGGEQLLHDGQHASAAERFSTALALWRGQPLAELDDHPRLVACRIRLDELRTTAREAHAEARLADPGTRAGAIADLRAVLEQEPLRARARLALMHGLEAAGRRADALAVYDAGRRLYARSAGLEPPEDLRQAFARLLEDERRATRRATPVRAHPRSAPDGLLEVTRWVADDGDLPGALTLAVRGAWWWWLGGHRGRAHDLLQDLLQRASKAALTDGTVRLAAEAWAGVFGSHRAQEALALDRADTALRTTSRPAWSPHDALAAVLVAERLYERGEHHRAGRLLALAARYYSRGDDEWGQTLCATISARGRLLAGDISTAEGQARARAADFADLDDVAGQMMALDIIGYCAEIRGDLHTAAHIHTRALHLARRAEAPDWEAAQLTRLGNVGALAGRPDAVDHLSQAAELGIALGSNAVTALCRNGLGVALSLQGEGEAAAAEHHAAYGWYQQTGSPSGLSYTGARLAMLHGPEDTAALTGAVDSLHLAVQSRDPRAVAHSLEALGLVTDQPADAARALGAAAALRKASTALLPPIQLRPLRHRQRQLRTQLGSNFSTHWSAGVRAPVCTARHW
ncbi:MAG TPA: AfsR/SARP family transcriptional regulator [Nocardioidaceae bacterium]|nr:AfsR/SARP family transcriptional regulator [Nocardioidaceae bacterium]